MSKKKRRSKPRKAHKKNPRRAHARKAPTVRKRRHARKNPAPSRRRGKRRHKMTSARTRRTNPSHFRRRSSRRRAHRRNPMSPYVLAGLACVLGLGVGAVEGIAPAFLSKNVNTAQYIRMGLAAAGVVGGIYLAKDHPIVGTAIAAPSFAILAAGPVNAFLATLLAPKPAVSATATAAATKQSGLVRQLGALVAASSPPALGAVYGGNLSGYSAHGAPPQLGAVYGSDMGAVYGSDMGDPLVSAPWHTATPFG